MTIHTASHFVFSAAKAHANGSDKAADILSAVAFMESYLKDQDEPKQDQLFQEPELCKP